VAHAREQRLRLPHLARGDVAGVGQEALRDVDDARDPLRQRVLVEGLESPVPR
jgi:hypothetical protein